MFRALLVGLSLLFFVSCTSTSYKVEGFEYPIKDIQKAIVDNIMGGVGHVHHSRRIFYSKIFTRVVGKTTEKLIMKIEVKGDRRPYALLVDVKRASEVQGPLAETYDLGKSYEGSESLSKSTVLKIEASLNKRQSEKNIFDDFRVF